MSMKGISGGINPISAQPTRFSSLGSSLWRKRRSAMGLVWQQRVQDGSYQCESLGNKA